MGPARRWPNYVACALGLALALIAYRAQWRYSELPPDFAADTLSYPVELAGYRAANPERLRFLAESWPPGSLVTITEQGGAQHEVALVLRQGRVSLVLTALSGLVFLAAAAVFFAPRSHRSGVGGFFWISLLYGLAIMVGGIYFPRENRTLVTIVSLVQAACLAALPAIFLRLALTFPQRSAVLSRHRWLTPVIGAAALAIFLWRAVALLRYFAAPTVTNGERLDPAAMAADVSMVAFTCAGVAVFAVRGHRLETTRERRQVRWLLWGFAIGAAPYVLLRTLPSLFGVSPLMPDYVDRVIELAIPFAFTMAVVRDQFLDIDVIIRRSLLYGLLTAGLVGVYLVAGIVFGRWLGAPRGIDPWIAPVILGLGAGMAFGPLRRLLGRSIDSALFKLSHDSQLLLDHLDRQLARLETRRELAAMVRELVDRVLLPQRSTVFIVRSEGPVLEGDLAPRIAGDAVAHLADRAAPVAGLAAAPQSTSMPEIEDAAFPPGLRDAGYRLAQPLAVQERVVGVILVGDRTNERRFVEPDLDFLAGCARLAAQHLERIGLVRTVAEETLARQRLAEVARLKSEFLSHVAHDLRTPVTGITWSARNLVDGVVGPLTAEQAECAQSVVESSEHLNRLVSNLLEISRLEQGSSPLVLAALDAIAVWRRAMRTIEPLALAKNVTVVLEGADHAVAVRGDADKLAEVAVNILDNAVKYTAPDTAVTVTVEAPDATGLAVSVRDRGPGLGGQDVATLVARFAQGDPSPSSSRKGFGLGLHIAATYLESMGGALSGRDLPEGGAEFTCRLPLAETASPPGEEGAP